MTHFLPSVLTDAAPRADVCHHGRVNTAADSSQVTDAARAAARVLANVTTQAKNRALEAIAAVDNVSPYGVIFDEDNHNWSADEDLSMLHLRCQEQYANDILQTRGHIFLNEVYKMLGFPHTPAGAVTGWVKGNGDDFVSFNIHDGIFEGEDKNGRTVTKWALDFNVDGVMYDKI